MSAPATQPNPQLTPVQTQIIVALAQGTSHTVAANAAGIHRSTIYEWQKTNPAFRQALEYATEEYRVFICEQLTELSAKALNTLDDILSDPKASAGARLRASLAILNRPTYPEKGWTLPASVHSSREEQVIRNFAALKMDYDAFRMNEALSRAGDPTKSDTFLDSEAA